MADIGGTRKEYGLGELRRSNLEEDPFAQFDKWYQAAVQSGVLEVNAMTLATVNQDKQPSQRLLLLKLYDKQGFVFYTNYNSRKAVEITENPQASLLFWWQSREQQIRIEGKIEKIAENVSDEYFASREKTSRYAAIASPQSQVLESKEDLVDRYEEVKQQYLDKESIPRPDYWGGYRLIPNTFEFWQGGSNRLHDRFRYTHVNDTWMLERLAP